MEESTVEKVSPYEREAQIILAEAICVMVMLLALFVLKFCFTDLFTDVQAWCRYTFSEETDSAEVLTLPEANGHDF